NEPRPKQEVARVGAAVAADPARHQHAFLAVGQDVDAAIPRRATAIAGALHELVPNPEVDALGPEVLDAFHGDQGQRLLASRHDASSVAGGDFPQYGSRLKHASVNIKYCAIA